MRKSDKKAILKKKQPQDIPVDESFYKKHRNRIFLGLLLLLTIIVYSDSLRNGFTNWDDDRHITLNNDIKNISLQNIKTIFSTSYVGMYHPLTTLSFAVEYSIFGLSAPAFHTTNLLLHLLNILLIYFLVLWLLKSHKATFFTAFIMALHPMHVESVCWITERKDLLYALFFISALIVYIKYIKDTSKIRNLILVLILFILSLLSKSAAVVLPVVMLLIDWFSQRKITVKILLEKVPFFLFSILFGVISIYSQKVQNITYDAEQTYHVIDKIFLVSYSLTFYLINFFLPFNLSVFHAFPIKVDGYLPVACYLSFGFIVILIYSTYKFLRKSREIIFGLSFFLICVFLVLQVIQIGYTVVGERYTYLPYVGLAIAVFYFGENMLLSKMKKYKLYLKSIFAIYGLLLCSLTFSRNAVWKDNNSLWSDAISHDNSCSFAYYNRASANFAVKDFQKALTDYNMALKNNIKDADSYNNRGLCKYMLNDLTGAISDYDKAIKINSKSTEFYINRANAKDKLKDFKSAIEDYTKSIHLNSLSADIYYYRGLSKISFGDAEGAIKDFESALKINPKNVEVYKSIGSLKIDMNDKIGALEAYSKVLDLSQSDADTYNNRGNLKYDLNNKNGALDDYTMAIKLKPDFEGAYFNRAATRMTTGDFKGAIDDYDKVVGLNPKSEVAWNDKGTANISLKKYKVALADFNAAVEINPQYAEAYKNKGIAEYYLKENKAACEDIQKAVSLGSAHAKKLVKMVCR